MEFIKLLVVLSLFTFFVVYLPLRYSSRKDNEHSSKINTILENNGIEKNDCIVVMSSPFEKERYFLDKTNNFFLHNRKERL